jgi:quinol monooxygenase YgiN
LTEPIIFVDTSEVREGKLEELRRGVRELAEFVEARESDPISYEIYFSADGSRMTVVQVHPDAASMERHMEIAGPVFARFADMVDLRTVDIYGSPSERVVEQLQRKADLLGTATVTVHDRQAGFARFGRAVRRSP